jgi:hypothetical protein
MKNGNLFLLLALNLILSDFNFNFLLVREFSGARGTLWILDAGSFLFLSFKAVLDSLSGGFYSPENSYSKCTTHWAGIL